MSHERALEFKEDYKKSQLLFEYIEARVIRDFTKAIKQYSLKEKMFLHTRTKNYHSILNKISKGAIKSGEGGFLDIVSNSENNLKDIVGARLIAFDEVSLAHFLHYLRVCDAYKRIDLKGYFGETNSVFSNGLIDSISRKEGFKQKDLEDKNNEDEFEVHREYEALHLIVNLDHSIDVNHQSIFQDRVHVHREKWEDHALSYINKLREELPLDLVKYITKIPIEIQIHTSTSYEYTKIQRPLYDAIKTTSSNSEGEPENLGEVNALLASIKNQTRTMASLQQLASLITSDSRYLRTPLLDRSFFSLLPEYSDDIFSSDFENLSEINDLTEKVINGDIFADSYTASIEGILNLFEQKNVGVSFVGFPNYRDKLIERSWSSEQIFVLWAIHRVCLNSIAIAICTSKETQAQVIFDWWARVGSSEWVSMEENFSPNDMSEAIYREVNSWDDSFFYLASENENVMVSVFSDPVPIYRASQLAHNGGRYGISNEFKNSALLKLERYSDFHGKKCENGFPIKSLPNKLKIVGDIAENIILQGFISSEMEGDIVSGPSGSGIVEAMQLIDENREDIEKSLVENNTPLQTSARRIKDIELMLLMLASLNSNLTEETYLDFAKLRKSHLDGVWLVRPGGEENASVRIQIYKLFVGFTGHSAGFLHSEISSLVKEIEGMAVPFEKKLFYNRMIRVLLAMSQSVVESTGPFEKSSDELKKYFIECEIDGFEYTEQGKDIEKLSRRIDYVNVGTSLANLASSIAKLMA